MLGRITVRYLSRRTWVPPILRNWIGRTAVGGSPKRVSMFTHVYDVCKSTTSIQVVCSLAAKRSRRRKPHFSGGALKQASKPYLKKIRNNDLRSPIIACVGRDITQPIKPSFDDYQCLLWMFVACRAASSKSKISNPRFHRSRGLLAKYESFFLRVSM